MLQQMNAPAEGWDRQVVVPHRGVVVPRRRIPRLPRPDLPLWPGLSFAFPQVGEVTTTIFLGVPTDHNVNMPAVVDAGDLLLIAFSNRQNDTPSTPTGWTQLRTLANGTTGRLTILGKDAIGNEDGTLVNLTTTIGRNAVAQVYRITVASWLGALASDVVVSTGITGSTTAPDPDGLTSGWGAVDVLWIAVAGWATAGDTANLTAYPANYTDGIWAEASDANPEAALGSARRALNAASDDPGAFTLDASNSWTAMTVAVRPAVAMRRRLMMGVGV